jgi:hypothetical protein
MPTITSYTTKRDLTRSGCGHVERSLYALHKLTATECVLVS